MKTCKYCGNKYEDSWQHWSSKYCCKNCFKNKNTKYKIGDSAYSFYNIKEGTHGLLTAVFTKVTITKVYTINRPTTNGLYQYACRYYNPKHNKDLISYRFVHQIFSNEEECLKFIELTNERRKVMREAYNKLNNI